MNPIKNLWGIMVKRLVVEEKKNMAAMERKALEIWENIQCRRTHISLYHGIRLKCYEFYSANTLQIYSYSYKTKIYCFSDIQTL